MPPKKKAAPKIQKSFEDTLWETATMLRGSVESSDWSGATETTLQGCPMGERGVANQNGVAGFVLANGSMSTNTEGEGEIPQKMVENDLVDCMIALTGQLFYTTQNPVCLWFLKKNKRGGGFQPPSLSNNQSQLRNREGETLFIDARKIGSMISRTQKELLADDISAIVATYHNLRSDSSTDHRSLGTDHSTAAYADVAGYCKSATLEEIRKHDFVLTPGRYVGAAELEDDGIPFETKMTEMSQTFYAQIDEAKALDQTIADNLKSLGYGRR